MASVAALFSSIAFPVRSLTNIVFRAMARRLPLFVCLLQPTTVCTSLRVRTHRADSGAARRRSRITSTAQILTPSAPATSAIRLSPIIQRVSGSLAACRPSANAAGCGFSYPVSAEFTIALIVSRVVASLKTLDAGNLRGGRARDERREGRHWHSRGDCGARVSSASAEPSCQAHTLFF